MRVNPQILTSWDKVMTSRLAQEEAAIDGEFMTPEALQSTFSRAVAQMKGWTVLRDHVVQQQYYHEVKRFKISSAGRRSGKSEIAKRIIAEKACLCTYEDGWFVAAAPTRDHAKRLFWRDLKKLIPKVMWAKKPNETDLIIYLKTGVEVQVMGMDEPSRIEGRILDGILLDEFASMKIGIWDENVRPALSTEGREGWAIILGVPEGRNHYYDMFVYASSGQDPEWGAYTWFSSDIINKDEVEKARLSMDPLTFQQEYEGAFVTFSGRVYYTFDRKLHSSKRTKYDPNLDLNFCFDFNVAPGVACVVQEQPYPENNERIKPIVTAAIGEVWIPKGSNSLMVARKLLHDWGHHQRDVFLYGDATGGASGSAKVNGSDWDLIKGVLRPHFGERLKFRVAAENPRERVRVNSFNSRLLTVDGWIGTIIDPINCKHLCEDLDGVVVKEGTAGEIDKDINPMLTHISDGVGYYMEKVHPVRKEQFVTDSY